MCDVTEMTPTDDPVSEDYGGKLYPQSPNSYVKVLTLEYNYI